MNESKKILRKNLKMVASRKCCKEKRRRGFEEVLKGLLGVVPYKKQSIIKITLNIENILKI